MKIKVIKSAALFLITVGMIGIIVCFEINEWPVGSSIAGLIAGISIMPLLSSFVDLSDNTNWKMTQRKLSRAKLIDKDTVIRVSFAYLYRIKIDGKYFLVKNARGTEKYQPVGGVYKLFDSEAVYLREQFYAEDDDKIPIDKSSKGDYRLRIKNKYLRKFIKRFNKGTGREYLDDLSREFVEEIFDTNILKSYDFGIIQYTYAGQYITELKYGEHFQCYELLLADILHLEISEEQEALFRNLIKTKSSLYTFATDSEIKSLGIKSGSSELVERISNHTSKILMENADKLTKAHTKSVLNKRFSVNPER